MIPIAQCESQMRQFDSKGNPLRSKTSDIGLLQINQVHWGEARSLGLDIFNNVDDNISMGRVVYDREGLNAWTCNKKV